MRDVLRRADDPVFSSSARRLAKRASAKRRKISPRTGVEYCPAFRPEFARNWSAAAQRRFSSVWLAVSFSVGATQRMLPPNARLSALVILKGTQRVGNQRLFRQRQRRCPFDGCDDLR